jgi:hypothetical protein
MNTPNTAKTITYPKTTHAACEQLIQLHSHSSVRYYIAALFGLHVLHLIQVSAAPYMDLLPLPHSQQAYYVTITSTTAGVLVVLLGINILCALVTRFHELSKGVLGALAVTSWMMVVVSWFVTAVTLVDLHDVMDACEHYTGAIA